MKILFKEYYEYLKSEPGWMLLLLPGFLSYVISRFISDYFKDFSILEQTMIFLIFSITSLIFAILTFSTVNYVINILTNRENNNQKHLKNKKVFLNSFFLIIVIIYSIIIGLVTGVALNKNTLPYLLCKINVINWPTKQTEIRPLMRLLYLNANGRINIDGDGRGFLKRKTDKRKESYTRVYLIDGQIIEGYPFFYTLSEDLGEIYLSPACKIQNLGNQKLKFEINEGPGILIYENQITHIDFIDIEDSQCAKLRDSNIEKYEKP